MRTLPRMVAVRERISLIPARMVSTLLERMAVTSKTENQAYSWAIPS